MKKGLIREENRAYTSNEVVCMVKETRKGNIKVRSHFKSTTQAELDMKIAELLAGLINKELETVK